MSGALEMVAAAATSAAPRIRVAVENCIRRNRREIEDLERQIAADGDSDGHLRSRVRGLLIATAALAKDLG